MTGGFSFCGTHISRIGLEYAPEIEDTYVYKSAKARIHEETYDGHNGGYLYGMSREPKEMILRCYFEETEIDRGIMAKVYALFREGKSGTLIFDRRPWCSYYATVTDLDTTGLTNYLNGIIKITMKAYYPYATSNMMWVDKTNQDAKRIYENTAFFESKDQVPPVLFCQTSPLTEETSILLANPGTEYAHVGIAIAGNVGQGVDIINETTGQSCGFVAMSETEFDGDNYVYLDGVNGKTVAVKNDFSTIAFLYHDGGFIQLAPGYPCIRDLYVTVKNGQVYTVNKLYDRNSGETREEAEANLKGKHIWLKNKWYEIAGIGQEYDENDEASYKEGQRTNEHHILLTEPFTGSFATKTMITQLNKIIVRPRTTMSLTRLKFDYKATFA